MDFPLRAVVAWRQIAESRMWMRNGQSAVQLASNYAVPPLCKVRGKEWRGEVKKDED